jgi:hypothetical protein
MRGLLFPNRKFLLSFYAWKEWNHFFKYLIIANFQKSSIISIPIVYGKIFSLETIGPRGAIGLLFPLSPFVRKSIAQGGEGGTIQKSKKNKILDRGI